MALTTTTGGGTQTTTQSPQTVGSGTGTAQARNVQPGTATSVLTSSDGVTLHAQAVTSVSLGTATATTSPTVPVKKHHVDGLALGFAAILFTVAVVMFWLTARPVKSTTD